MEHRTELRDGEWISANVEGEGQAVVLLHGIPGCAEIWDEMASRISGETRVIIPDLLGFGASSRPSEPEDLWADRQAEAVLALLDDLGVERVVLVGHDYGGPVAAHLLDIAPDRVAGLALAATNAFGDTPIPFPLSGILWPLIGGPWARMLFSAPSLRMMVKQGVGENGPSIDPKKYVGDASQARSIRTIFTTALRELAERYAPVTKAFQRADVPTVILWGSEDPFFPLEQGKRTARLIDGARLAELDGAGHFLPEERPDALASAVREVLAQLK